MNYIVKQLKKGEKIVIGCYGSWIDGRLGWGDRVVLVPLSASVKVGDLVYCKAKGRTRLRILHSMQDGVFQVKDDVNYRPFTIPFEDIYGEVYEVIKASRGELIGNLPHDEIAFDVDAIAYDEY